MGLSKLLNCEHPIQLIVTNDSRFKEIRFVCNYKQHSKNCDGEKITQE